MFRENTDFLEANSLRELTFYSDYLTTHVRGASLRSLRADSKEERLEKLNAEISTLIKKNRAPKTIVGQMRSAFRATQLTLGDFKWLDKKDERLCNWVWGYLKRYLENADTFSDPSHPPLSLLSATAFKTEKSNVYDRSTDVVNAFYDGEANYDQQQGIIDFLKSQWLKVYQDKSIIHWLEEDNTEQWIWAWSYLQNITDRPLINAWDPINDMDKKAAFIATLDLSDNPDRKALIIDKMKKAWSQKKFREKTSGKRPYSISMTLKVKQKLDALAEEKGLKINETIAELIEKEYAQQQDYVKDQD